MLEQAAFHAAYKDKYVFSTEPCEANRNYVSIAHDLSPNTGSLRRVLYGHYGCVARWILSLSDIWCLSSNIVIYGVLECRSDLQVRSSVRVQGPFGSEFRLTPSSIDAVAIF